MVGHNSQIDNPTTPPVLAPREDETGEELRHGWYKRILFFTDVLIVVIEISLDRHLPSLRVDEDHLHRALMDVHLEQ
jgi:hypothetical protein